jgi:uncharacterized RDD family membrane protein YckC
MSSWIYEIWFYLDKILFIAAFVIVLTWPKRKGKIWLILSLLFMILGPLVFYLTNKFIPYEFSSDYNPSIRQFLYMIGFAMDILATIFLLCFVIVAKSDRLEPPQKRDVVELDKYLRGLSEKEKRSILQRREWTYFLDNLIVNIGGGLLLMVPAVIIAGASRSVGHSDETIANTVWFISILISVTYCLFKDSIAGRSIAKAITGLRVVDASTGEPIGPGQSIARNWIFLIPVFPIVELIVANVRQDKRRLGDLMANTIVIRVKRDEDSEPTEEMPNSLPNEPKVKETHPVLENPEDEFIKFTCDCGQKIKVPITYKGKKGRCPKCHNPIQIPDA